MEHRFVSKLIVDIFNFYSNQKIDSDTYKYCKNVQHRLSLVKGILETLGLIRLLVAEKHPSITINEETGFDREAILSYHVENYFIRLNNYKPEITQLIAAVYEWDIATTDELLQKATSKKLNDVATIIQNLDALLLKAQPVKSDITDSTGMSAADISLIESVKEAENLIKGSGGGKDSYEDDKNEYYNTSVANNLTEMAEIEADLYSNLVAVLDTLYPAYAAKVPDAPDQ